MGWHQPTKIVPGVRRASLSLLPLERRHRITSICDHRLVLPCVERLDRRQRTNGGAEPISPQSCRRTSGPATGRLLLVLATGLAAAMLLGTLVLFFSFDSTLRSVADSQIRLEPDSWFYQAWRGSSASSATSSSNATPPFTARYFLFGLSNRVEFLKGARPVVQEFGPFVYRRRVIRRKNETVVYRQKSHYELDQHQSLSLDTKIWVLNYPLFAVLDMVHGLLPRGPLGLLTTVVQNLVSSVMRDMGENLVEQRTAWELLHGRRLRFLTLFSSFMQPLRALGIKLPDISSTSGNLANFSFGFGPQLSDQDSSPSEHFVRTERNHLADGVYRVAGGIKKLSAYRAPCDRIQGSGGMFFGLDRWLATRIDFFSHDLCRRIVFSRNTTYQYGGMVPVIRFDVSVDMFDPVVPGNQCYCRSRQCPRGWTDASPCYGNVPAAVSFPHFYNAHRAAIRGLSPDRSKHLGFVDLEPNLGLIINGRVPMQFNLRVRAIPVSGLRAVRNSLMPMFWVEQSASLQGDQIYWLSLMSDTFRYGKYFILAGGLVLTGLWLALLLNYASRRRKRRK